MSSWYAEFAVRMLSNVLVVLTPELRGMLVDFAKNFHARAAVTPNPFDDIAAGLLYALLGLSSDVK